MIRKVEPVTEAPQRLCKRAAAVRLSAPIKFPSARSQFHQSATVVQANRHVKGRFAELCRSKEWGRSEEIAASSPVRWRNREVISEAVCFYVIFGSFRLRLWRGAALLLYSANASNAGNRLVFNLPGRNWPKMWYYFFKGDMITGGYGDWRLSVTGELSGRC